MTELTLTGLDGTNPLAYLAAVGVLEAVQENYARLSWRYSGGWRAVLVSSHGTFESLIDRLDEDRRSCEADPALALTYDGKRDLKPPPAVFRDYLLTLVSRATNDQRRSVDWASAFATDVAVDNNGNTKPTALHFTAGNQQFLKMAREIVSTVAPEDLHEAVSGPWTYARLLPVMRWDATSTREYALRAKNPSDQKEKERGVPGADWLALRGLVCLPAMPQGTRVHTTACVGGWKNGRFRWPLWTAKLSAALVRTLLAQNVEDMPTAERRARGIAAILSSGIKRNDQGGYGSFEPASPV